VGAGVLLGERYAEQEEDDPRGQHQPLGHLGGQVAVDRVRVCLAFGSARQLLLGVAPAVPFQVS
jgi:hypothetical protein